MGEPFLEIAGEKVWIRASAEIVVQLQKGWSRPVQAKITGPSPDGSWEMTFRTFSLPGPEEVTHG